jgi:hypothetical protein
MLKRLVIAVAVVLSPALLFAQKVSYDYEKTANFSAFKTYALKRRASPIRPRFRPRLRWPSLPPRRRDGRRLSGAILKSCPPPRGSGAWQAHGGRNDRFRPFWSAG